jgi:potassium-transporting ATPase potassium-binding subunit
VVDRQAFETAASFTTNTNWQSYLGESTMSYLSLMTQLAFHNFTSAAVGIAIAVALVRSIARRSGAGTQHSGPVTLPTRYSRWAN